MRFPISLLIAVSAWTLDSRSSFAAESGLDVNDVAVLFPIDGQHKPVPNIDLNDASLLTPPQFDAVIKRATEIGITASPSSSIAKASDWSIVAFRVDPCAPQDHGVSIEPCLTELRVVAQPRARFAPADSTLHLIYQINEGLPSARDSLAQDLVQLKKSTEALMGRSSSIQPLGVHPLLLEAFKAKRDDVPLLFSNFVRKYAKAASLTKLTMMGLRQGAPTDWIFFGGDIKDGAWVQTPVPNLADSPTSSVELKIQGPMKTFEGTSIDAALSLAEYFGLAPDAIAPAAPSIDRTLHILENPQFTDRNNVDCISCHASTSVRLSADVNFARVVEGVTARVPVGITGYPAAQTLPNHPLHWNMRAFGYFGLKPTVSMRTVHEASQSAETFNKILALAAPGPDCSAVHDAVMNCFVDNSIEFGTVTPAEQCLSSCRPKALLQRRLINSPRN